MTSLNPDRSRQPTAVTRACYLCHLADLPIPAAPEATVVLRPASGPPHPVGLCASCQAGRPHPDSPTMGPADVAWRVLTRDAEALLQDYENKQWLPYKAELRFAEDLARLPWTETSLRAAQRTAPHGRLSPLLDHACLVLRHTNSHDPALLPLRHLVDILADDAEQAPPTAPAPAGARSGQMHLLPHRPPQHW